MNLSPGLALPVILAGGSPADRDLATRNGPYIQRLARVSAVEFAGDGEPEPSGAAVALIGDLRILVPLAGLIDANKEIDRLGKQLAKVRKDLDSCTRKLTNSSFVDNAPPEIVQQERDRVADFERISFKLEAQIARLRKMD
jgi:valyl-tRNA synthetase